MALETRQKRAAKRTQQQEAETDANPLRVPCTVKNITGSTLLLLLLLTVGCTSPKARTKQASLLTEAQFSAKATSLTEARRGFQTVLRPQKRNSGAIESVEQAPAKIFRTLKYPSPSGALAAYLSPNPGDGKKHPAVLWITGGDCNSINDLWSPKPRTNDQTAAALRQAGIVLMFPSLRGGNDNPGQKEGFLGEVDDVLAAANYLAKQPYVDPKRIFLGGHSTGGTLALLVAETSNRFRAVFAFGPVADASLYGSNSEFLPFDSSNRQEVELRSPGYWLASIRSPVWVFEGTEGNIEQLQKMAKISTNPQVHFIELKDVGHFATLAPTNEIIARKILQDTGAVSNLSLTVDEVNRAFR